MVEKEKKNHSKQVSLGCLSSPIHSGCYMDCMNSFLHNNIQKKNPITIIEILLYDQMQLVHCKFGWTVWQNSNINKSE